MRNANVATFESPVKLLEFDEIVCLCNVSQVADLTNVLAVTLPERRLSVAMAWVNVREQIDLIRRTGTHSTDNALVVSWGRWLNRQHRMPLGAACRLARVFGVSPELLLEWYIQ